MAFRFDDYCERWAEHYRLIQHNPAARGGSAKRFYRVDDIFLLQSFLSNLTAVKTPCMLVVTQREMEVNSANDKQLFETLRVFFLVRMEGTTLQNGPTEEVAAADAKSLGVEMAEDFLAWLVHDKRDLKNPDLAGFTLAGTNISNLPQKFNGWWPTEIMLRMVRPRLLCINPERYDRPFLGLPEENEPSAETSAGTEEGGQL